MNVPERYASQWNGMAGCCMRTAVGICTIPCVMGACVGVPNCVEVPLCSAVPWLSNRSSGAHGQPGNRADHHGVLDKPGW